MYFLAALMKNLYIWSRETMCPKIFINIDFFGTAQIVGMLLIRIKQNLALCIQCRLYQSMFALSMGDTVSDII